MAGIQQSLLLIIQTVLGLYAVAVILRVMMRAIHADFYQPIVQGVSKITDWPANKLKKFIPDFKNIELAGVVLLLAVLLVKAFLVSFVQGFFPNIIGVLIWVIGSAIHLSLQTLFYLVIIRALLSWLPAFQVASLQPLLMQLTEPVMAPARKYIPLVGGFDLSPIAVLVVIQVLMFIVANPIMNMGLRIAV